LESGAIEREKEIFITIIVNCRREATIGKRLLDWWAYID